MTDNATPGVNELAISTHTLTWSVTGTDRAEVEPQYNFNSHAHVERDCTVLGACQEHLHFNSHAHVERDRRCSEWQMML